ncbi:MAG: ornithine carbamoyltransferase [Spirochaetaceae bacterium]|jgi:ornithine carbamoyltransferase|nr:ornithine carbamoyltransferase [Spirochaetaceae bacterium]
MNIESLKGRSLLTWLDFSAEEIRLLLDLAKQLKLEKQGGKIYQRWVGKTLALLFEKRSTRTRCSFETSFGEEGGHPVFLSMQDIQLGGKETIEDTARVLGRMFSAIEFRGFKQSTVETLAKYSGVPVFNGLTDDYHPTQALCDIMTLEEFCCKGGETCKGKKLVYSGDGRNNVANSLMVISAKLGAHFTVISPSELAPDSKIVDTCTRLAAESGASITVTSDLNAAEGADALYTDVWTSMGEEAKHDERVRLLKPYQVNSSLMAKTGKSDTIFLHCLPAVRGEEVTAEIIDGPASHVFDQAENRKYTIKAIMLAMI